MTKLMGSEGSESAHLLPEVKGPTLKASELSNTQTINGVEDEAESELVDSLKDGSIPPFKKKILISVLFSLLMIQTLFLNVENVLPLWTADNMPDLTSIELSFILRYFL